MDLVTGRRCALRFPRRHGPSAPTLLGRRDGTSRFGALQDRQARTWRGFWCEVIPDPALPVSRSFARILPESRLSIKGASGGMTPQRNPRLRASILLLRLRRGVSSVGSAGLLHVERQRRRDGGRAGCPGIRRSDPDAVVIAAEWPAAQCGRERRNAGNRSGRSPWIGIGVQHDNGLSGPHVRWAASFLACTAGGRAEALLPRDGSKLWSVARPASDDFAADPMIQESQRPGRTDVLQTIKVRLNVRGELGTRRGSVRRAECRVCPRIHSPLLCFFRSSPGIVELDNATACVSNTLCAACRGC